MSEGNDLPVQRPSAVPPLVTEAVRAAVAGAAPPPPIFTDAGVGSRSPRRFNPALEEYVGKTIYSQFVVEELCGVGSTGTVFRARQLGIGRPVALKVLHPDLKSQPEIVARFHREAQIASRISHPNIVHLYLAGVLPDGNLFLAMEYVTGIALSRAVEPGGMPLERAVHIIDQVLSALGEAHRVGIVHRDLKPENVMLTRVGEDPDFVKVLDFGIARILDSKTVATRSGLVFGSPRYISPEAAAGDPADARSDIYSCGVLLYEMLAGRPPFDAEKPLDLLMKHIREDAPRLSSVRRSSPLPSGVEAAVHQALEKKPDRRFRSAEVFAQALRNAAGMAERRLGMSSPRLPDAPAAAMDSHIRPPAGAKGSAPSPAPGHAFVMAAPVLPAAVAVPAPPAAPPPATPPPVSHTPAGPAGSAPPFVVASTPAMSPVPPGPQLVFASASGLGDSAAGFDDGAPRSRKGLWIAIVLAVVALGLAITLLVVLFGGSDDAKRASDGATVAPDAALEAAAVDAGVPDVAEAAAPAPSADAAAVPPDAAPEAVVDQATVEAEVAAETPADVAEDDAGPETAPDASPDVAPDAGPDAAEETGTAAGDASAEPTEDGGAAAPVDQGGDRTTRRDSGRRRRDVGRDAGRDGNQTGILQTFHGDVPVIVTTPKDVGR